MTELYLNARRKYIKSHMKPDYWIFRSWVSVLVCIATIILDFSVMTAFFTELRSQSILMLALGVIVTIDVIPMIVVPAYKKQLAKLDFVQKWLMFLSLAVIVVMMVSMVGVKLAMMEILNESRSVPITEGQIFIEALIPVATSTANAIVTWCTYNPLKAVIQRVLIRIAECEFDLIVLCSRKSMYDSCNEDYRSELEMQAARKYLATCGRIDAIAADIKSYFACHLAERIANPTSVNALSAPQEKTEIPKLKLPPSVNLADIYESSEFTDVPESRKSSETLESTGSHESPESPVTNEDENVKNNREKENNDEKVA